MLPVVLVKLFLRTGFVHSQHVTPLFPNLSIFCKIYSDNIGLYWIEYFCILESDAVIRPSRLLVRYFLGVDHEQKLICHLKLTVYIYNTKCNLTEALTGLIRTDV